MNAPQPVRLSIIIPTVLRQTLERTIESILAAGLAAADEVIVVPDVGCKDGGEPHADDMAMVAGLLADVSARCARALSIWPAHPLGGWGGPARNLAISHAQGTHLVFIDDDDWYEADALTRIRGWLAAEPDMIHVWRMVPRGGGELWRTEEIRHGNVGTPMIAVPVAYAGRWTDRYEGDLDFALDSLTRASGRTRWHPDVLVGCG